MNMTLICIDPHFDYRFVRVSRNQHGCIAHIIIGLTGIFWGKVIHRRTQAFCSEPL
jgi:uncharacterized membrane protein YeaQ/YmgE (transglycosylase-associated protein family)